MTFIERNSNIVEARMIEQMEKSFKLGRKLIDTELDTGILNFIVKPLVKTFYDYWTQNDARYGTMQQIKVTLEAGKRLLIDYEEDFGRIIDELFPRYLKADQTTHQCRKSHKNYDKLVEIARKTFVNYVKEVTTFLEVKGDATDYGDLCRLAFTTKENAEKILIKQLEYTDEAISLIEEDPSILNIPVAKRLIVKVLRKGFEQTRKEFMKALNETYNNEH